MNGAGVPPKRRSARLSGESVEENEPPAKKSKVDGVLTSTVGTKEADGDAGVVGKKKRKGMLSLYALRGLACAVGGSDSVLALPCAQSLVLHAPERLADTVMAVYDDLVDDFAFAKRKKSKDAKPNGVRNSGADKTSPAKPPPAPAPAPPAEEHSTKTTQKKYRKRLPLTPERDAADKPVRRSKRLSDENEQDGKQASPHKAAHARSHQNHERSPSPLKMRPVTVEKKRRKAQDGIEEEKIMRIQLPFADTPVIKRNKEMRKASAENGSRRSSSGMRGRRASSLIDEGRGNGEYDFVQFFAECLEGHLAPLGSEVAESLAAAAERRRSRRDQESEMSNAGAIGLTTPPPSQKTIATATATATFLRSLDSSQLSQNYIANKFTFDAALPHSEVPSSEFYKHISAELTEPRRMRCLLGWCAQRALPSKPEPPKENTQAAQLEFQAQQTGS